MIKFKALQDIQLFLIEVNQVEKVSQVKDDFKPDPSLVEIYLKGRRSLIPKLKDFRRSQNTKEAWRKSRYHYMKGIKNFHKSTEGKKFHRALGRFLSTRDVSGRSYKRESYDAFTIPEVCEVLKALSSLKTHALLELDYWHPIDDEIELHFLIEELLASVSRMESGFLGSEVVQEDLDFLIRIVDPKALAFELAQHFHVEEGRVETLMAGEISKAESDNNASPYLDALNQAKLTLSRSVS